MRKNGLPIWISAPLAIGGFLVFTWLELRRPLRKTVEAKAPREIRNAAHAALGGVALALAEAPLVWRLASAVHERRLGLLPQFGMPIWLEIPAALLLMDYTFYVWHVFLHRVPFLWRFHLVHHTDLDLDASTALRFHFGELLVSIPWRAAQVILIGLRPISFSMWQVVFTLSILFHHSNLRLPIHWERRINRFIVTPRMHGIHHSIVPEETNANWSSGLTIWDWLHGTLRLNIPQDDIVIGVPAFRAPESVTLAKTIALPFEAIPAVWEMPGDGTPPPHTTDAAPHHLLA